MDWFAYYGLVLWYVVATEQAGFVVCCCWKTIGCMLIEWHLLPCMQFIWTSTYPFTRFLNLSPSHALSLSLVLTPVLCFLNFAFSPSLSLSYPNKRINGTIIAALCPPFSTCKSKSFQICRRLRSRLVTFSYSCVSFLSLFAHIPASLFHTLLTLFLHAQSHAANGTSLWIQQHRNYCRTCR
jgi:hypothetical protein